MIRCPGTALASGCTGELADFNADGGGTDDDDKRGLVHAEEHAF